MVKLRLLSESDVTKITAHIMRAIDRATAG